MFPLHLESIPAGGVLHADVCIVGSGPAGATLACELAGSALQVILLESGGFARDPAADALNEIENVGASRTLDQSMVRNRLLGGTSFGWAGRCASLDEIDYEARPWVPHSGWPIGPAAVEPFLARAGRHLGLGLAHDVTGEGFWQATGRLRPKTRIDPDVLLPFFWQYSRTRNPHQPVRFGLRLMRERAGNVRIITRATAVQIHPNPGGGQMHTVEVAARDDSRRIVRARKVVLCAGGIENARLLLASNRERRGGLGNEHDLVGRFLADHARGGVAVFDMGRADQLSPCFGFHRVRSVHGAHLFCQGLRLSPTAQAREGLLGCAVWLSELVASDDPWLAIRRIATGRANWLRDPVSVLANAGVLARGAHNLLVKGTGVVRKLHGLELNCIVEQAPNPDSRLTLSDRVDRHGMPLSRIDWRVGEQEQRTVRRTAQLTAAALASAGIKPPRLEDWVAEGQPFPPSFGDVAHHIGTTRMADDPRRGVVDAHCEVHGTPGLFVAGSSVFPTGGHANPTLMIVALAVRLADRLKQEAQSRHHADMAVPGVARTPEQVLQPAEPAPCDAD